MRLESGSPGFSPGSAISILRHRGLVILAFQVPASLCIKWKHIITYSKVMVNIEWENRWKVFRQCQEHSKWLMRDRDYYDVIIYEDNELGDDYGNCYKAYV